MKKPIIIIAIGVFCVAAALIVSPRSREAAMLQRPHSYADAEIAETETEAAPPMPATAKAPADAPTAVTMNALTMGALPAADAKRYLIRNATIGIEVDVPRDAAEAIATQIAAMNGYVGELNESRNAMGTQNIALTVRIPAEQFDDAMNKIDAAGKVLHQRIFTQDVTEEFIDTDARVRNMKRAETRILDHLERTAKLEDIMAVERELLRVRGEIERAEGRLRYLGHRIQYSTITITISEAPAPKSVVPAATFSSGAVLADAVRALVGFLQALWIRIIWVAVWSIVWAPVAIAALIAYRRARVAARGARV